MPIPPEKQALADALLTGEPVLARLASVNPATLQPHVVPVWFLWDGSALWISAFSSTRKVKNVAANLRIAVLIEPKDPGALQAVLMQGECQLISTPPEMVAEKSMEIYARYVGADKITDTERGWAVDPENRIIRLVPETVHAW